jgi:hypothetical protein
MSLYAKWPDRRYEKKWNVRYLNTVQYTTFTNNILKLGEFETEYRPRGQTHVKPGGSKSAKEAGPQRY